ncbi:MAG: succinate dehydrogenase assembly factor 2 [Aeromonas sp.]
MLSPVERSRLKWACRRGMLELDVIFMPFYENEFDTLSDADQQTFIRLLQSDDPDLFKWCMGHGVPADPAFVAMIALILKRNRARQAAQA